MAILGLGTSHFEFRVDPSADPELALVRGSQNLRIPEFEKPKTRDWGISNIRIP